MATDDKAAALARYRAGVDETVNNLAKKMLISLVGEEEAIKAAAAIGLAMKQVALASPDIINAGQDAIVNAVAFAALTGLRPGGVAPEMWIYPKGGSAGGMMVQASHRGLIKMIRAGGFDLTVGWVFAGEEYAYACNPFPEFRHVPNDDLPQTWDTLERVYVAYWPAGQREDYRMFVLSKEHIQARRAQGGAVWNKWPLEMAAKSTIKAAVARGLIPLSPATNTAIAKWDRDDDDVIDVSSTTKRTTRKQADPPASAPALPDHGAKPDPLASMKDDLQARQAAAQPAASAAQADEESPL